MSEQVFKSPGVFEREIDLSRTSSEIVGVPIGVIGTAEMGPAFVPVTVGSFIEFERKFGSLNANMFGPYAVNEFLKNRTAATYIRVLGAGANESTTDIETTRSQGTVTSAGFLINGSAAGVPAGIDDDWIYPTDNRQKGTVQFIAARHSIPTLYEVAGYPIFTDNDSFGTSGDQDAYMVRAMLMFPTGTRAEILDYTSNYSAPIGSSTDIATVKSYDGTDEEGCFKLVISSSAGSGFANDEGWAGIRILTASLNPSSLHYIGKTLNTNPSLFQTSQHLLYGDFPVEAEVAKVSSENYSVGLVSGSLNTAADGGAGAALSFLNMFGRFDTRYAAPRTTWFISQPYGDTEHTLFYFETISDGSVANDKFKISISSLRKSTDPKNPYGSFTVEVRSFDDNDTASNILEFYPNCTLNPNDDDYVARKIGDIKEAFSFDATSEDERRIQVTGKYANNSTRVRIVMNSAIERGDVPKDAIPFGFQGLPVIKTSDTLTDDVSTVIAGVGNSGALPRLSGVLTGSGAPATFVNAYALSGSILPPVPMRFKTTRGKVKATTSPAYTGEVGTDEIVDGRYYWGIKFERLPVTSSLSDSVLNSNASSTPNTLLSNYSKMLGIQKLGSLVTGSGADAFNNNKFTLSNVALYNRISDLTAANALDDTVVANLTGSAKEHMLEAAYIRNGSPESVYYTVSDSTLTNRITLGSLVSLTSSVYFNKFSDYNKFTNMFYGGFDGLNILDPDMAKMNDRSTSSQSGGKAAGGTASRYGLSSDYSPGISKANNQVAAYRAAARIITDPMKSRINILGIPGIRDSYVTDFASENIRDYSKAMYVMDIPEYSRDVDGNVNRMYDDSDGLPDVESTSTEFAGRAIDNNYVASYFPDVSIEDKTNNRPARVPASIAAIGALGYNDAVAYPWFAPAGFNRAALGFVVNTATRLTAADRDTLYESRINPIANFPTAGFVIFGQKTLQQAKSALDRVNVRRMLLEVKRLIVDVANRFVFENNTPEMRARFVAQITPLLSVIQQQQGIDQFKVIMDSSNNTPTDIAENRLNGRIVVVPTRAVEFVAMDFIITNSGVSFE